MKNINLIIDNEVYKKLQFDDKERIIVTVSDVLLLLGGGVEINPEFELYQLKFLQKKIQALINEKEVKNE